MGFVSLGNDNPLDNSIKQASSDDSLVDSTEGISSSEIFAISPKGPMTGGGLLWLKTLRAE